MIYKKKVYDTPKGAGGVMVVIVTNGCGDLSPNPVCISHSTYSLGKCMKPILLSPSMGR